MDVKYVNPFIMATITLFKTMLNVDVTPEKPTLKQEPYPSYDISGIIGLSGSAQGSISISFPKIMALKIVSAMIGVELKVVGPDLTDGIGEVANIIAGNAKQNLNGLNLSISLPNVIIGKDHVITSQRGIPVVIVPFKSPLGSFSMEVALKT
ncbi:MAG: chemotaxis protein CheX [Chitinivibrionales bacterium]